MKRNRAGEDELNPTSNNRSVLESARPGRAGDGGSGGEGRWGGGQAGSAETAGKEDPSHHPPRTQRGPGEIRQTYNVYLT